MYNNSFLILYAWHLLIEFKNRAVIQLPVASDRFMANIEIEGEDNEVEVSRDMR
jgi:hypothetical protein